MGVWQFQPSGVGFDPGWFDRETVSDVPALNGARMFRSSLERRILHGSFLRSPDSLACWFNSALGSTSTLSRETFRPACRQTGSKNSREEALVRRSARRLS